MSADWHIIFEQKGSASTATGAAGASASGTTQPQPQTSDTSGFFNTAFQFFKQILPFAGPLAIVIQSVRRSKIFSTFMDAFLTTLSAMVDILLIPLIPILGPALQLLIDALPFVMDISQKISAFITGFKSPTDAIEKIFNWLGDLGKNFGNILSQVFNNGVFADVGDKISSLMGSLGTVFGGAAGAIGKILADPTTDFWTVKLPAIAKIALDALKTAGADVWTFIKNVWSTDIVPALEAQFPGVKTFFDDLSTGVKNVGSIISGLTELVNMFTTAWNPNASLLTNLGGIIESFVDEHFPKLSGAVDNFFTTLQTFFAKGGGWDSLTTAITSFFATGGGWDSLKTGISDFLATTWPALKTAVANFSDDLTAFVGVTLPGWIAKGEQVWNDLVDTWNNKIYPVLQTVGDDFTKVGTVVGIVGDVFSSLNLLVLTPLYDAFKAILDILAPFVGADPLKSVTAAANNVTGIVNSVGTFFGDMIKGFQAVGTNYVQDEGLYYLHHGESVQNAAQTSQNSNSSSQTLNVVNNINVTGGQSGASTANLIANSLGAQIKQISIQGWS